MKKIIMLCLLMGASPLFAEAIATVLFTSNKVIANRNGVERSLARGAQLEAGDAIITAAGAVVNIKYLNGTLVNIGERSNYKILSYSPNAKDVQIQAELNTGKVHFKTTGKVKESLKTPVVALAILGTDARVYVASKTQTYLAVGSGRVQPGNSKPIGAGESILANPQGIVKSEFPAAGQVNTPKNAPGAVSNGSKQTESKQSNTRVAAKSREKQASSSKQKTSANQRRETRPATTSSAITNASNVTENIGTVITASQAAGTTATNAALAVSTNLAMIIVFC